MYRFSYVEHVGGMPVEMDASRLAALADSAKVIQTCQSIREKVAAMAASPGADVVEALQQEISVLKRGLPAICWHAWFPEGKRKNELAHPSGLIMIDVDHVKSPVATFKRIEKRALKLGLLVAHVTPSSQGLRLVFPIPSGFSLPEAQVFYAKALRLKVDECTKDLARLSFCVPKDYFLYLNEKELFEGELVDGAGGGSGAANVAGHSGSNGSGFRGSGDMNQAGSGIKFSDQPGRRPGDSGAYYNKVSDDEYDGDSARGLTAGSNSPSTPEPYPSSFEGIPYPLLVECLCEQLGGEPAHGSRNNFIFSMAAYLRYVCDDDPDWIAQVLPTYGEAQDKWRRTIESACQRAQLKVVPQLVKRALDAARHRLAVTLSQEDENQNEIPPEMPEKLPPLIGHLIKNVPEVCRAAVANGVFPALATHLHHVNFTLIDGTLKEPTFMCVAIAKQSSGKSAVNKPIEYILADIVERDEVNRQREQEWKNQILRKGSNKEKPERPDDLCVQVLVSDMTNAAFVQRMKDANGRYLYTNLEELELIKQLQTNGTKDVGKIICLCFDNGRYGQERVGSQSVTALVPTRWNWNASTTIQKGIDFFRNRLVDGTLSRVNFCTIIPDKSKPFRYGEYDATYAEVLKPYIQNLNQVYGNVHCAEALELAGQLQEQWLEQADLWQDEMLQDMTFRAVTIAYLKAMVLYIAHDMQWSPEIAEFMTWSLHYDLWCKQHFFSDVVKKAQKEEVVSKKPGRKNLLDLLPDVFTLAEAIQMRHIQGLDENAANMLYGWVHRGYIEFIREERKYYKTQTYKQRAK